MSNTTQSSQSSGSYTREDIQNLVNELDKFRDGLPDPQKELLAHLVAGAESLYTREKKAEDLVVVLEHGFIGATKKALEVFLNKERGKDGCYFWARSSTVAPK